MQSCLIRCFPAAELLAPSTLNPALQGTQEKKTLQCFEAQLQLFCKWKVALGILVSSCLSGCTAGVPNCCGPHFWGHTAWVGLHNVTTAAVGIRNPILGVPRTGYLRARSGSEVSGINWQRNCRGQRKRNCARLATGMPRGAC